MNIITIDFETYYDKQFSLSKLTTEEYIRHKYFEVIGVSVKLNDDSTQWYTGDKQEVEGFLRQFPWGDSMAVAHNSMFDMAILSWVFNIRPKRIADTLSMARALHSLEVGGSLKALAEYYGLGEKGTEVLNAIGKRREDFTEEEMTRYGEYCVNDVELTYRLFHCLIKQGFPLSELKLIDLTLRMFTEPVLQVGRELLEDHLSEIQTIKAEWLHKAEVERKQIMSNKQFAELLIGNGAIPPKKISATTGKETFAFAKTDEEFKALLEHENPIVQILVGARLGVKSTIEETRTQRFIDIAGRGSLPIPLRYYAAHTGRWGGDDKVNMQNLPRTSVLKNAILPPSGYVFIDCDSSQIEARTLAWLAGQNDLVQAFDRGEDVYKVMASAIYGKPADQITKDERFVGKTTILGCGYGMGAVKFKAQLKNFGADLEVEECERIIRVYRETYPHISGLWSTCNVALLAMMRDQEYNIGTDDVVSVVGAKGVRLPNRLYLKYPNLRKHNDEDTGKVELVYDTKRGKAVIPNRIYGGKLVENICQALARIVIGEQLLAVAKRYRVVMTVHDAIGCVVPEAEAEEALIYVQKCMRARPTWAPDLPLNCEGSYGYSYGECK